MGLAFLSLVGELAISEVAFLGLLLITRFRTVIFVFGLVHIFLTISWPQPRWPLRLGCHRLLKQIQACQCVALRFPVPLLVTHRRQSPKGQSVELFLPIEG